jgi:NADH:ubiquinone oxidoreductase subunit 5 (subunit L)/multisubunit Na+/H+ antiporter MnhA subunit
LLGWDGLGLTSYLLVIYYRNNKSIRAGILTALTNRIGDALLILAASWAYLSGHWSFSYSHYNVNILITLIVIMAAITKRAQIPFSA